MRDVRAFDANLSRELRKNLRAAVQPAVSESKQIVEAYGREKTDRTATIARSIKVSIMTGKRGAGVVIQVNRRQLTKDQSILANALNRNASWKHPVFQRRGRFGRIVKASQPPARYFTQPLKKAKPAATRAATDALKDAARQLDRGN